MKSYRETELPLWQALAVAIGIPLVATLMAVPFGLIALWLDFLSP